MKTRIMISCIVLSLVILIPQIFAEEADWKTFDVIGKYRNWDPAKPDQTFVAQYSVSNGTLISIGGNGHQTIAIVNTTENGLFEMKFPRNFPYTNYDEQGGKNTFGIMINGYGSNVYYTPEDEMDRLQNAVINDVNRPLPHPETFTKITDCFFVFEIPFYTYAKIEINYGQNAFRNNPYHGDSVPDDCIDKTLGKDKLRKYDYIPKPGEQKEIGVKLGHIVCPPQRELVWKHPDLKPACVKPETQEKLINRGWAKMRLVLPSDVYPDYEYELQGRNYLTRTLVDPNLDQDEKGKIVEEYANIHRQGKKFVQYYFQNFADNYELGHNIAFGLHEWGNDFGCYDQKMVIKDFDGTVLHEQQFEKYCLEYDGIQGWYKQMETDPFLCTRIGFYTVHIVNNQSESPVLDAFSCVV